MMRLHKHLATGLLSLVALTSCHSGMTQEDVDAFFSDDARKVLFFSNATGTRATNEYDRKPDEFLVQMIDRADSTLDACVYGFSKRNVIEAVIRAYYRGVDVRIVGDARHFGYGERGYRAMQEHRIPMQVGNQFHIMHNKFFVIDDRFTFVGTGNITTTGFTRNHNNWVVIDSPAVANDFGDEFDQMFGGLFSNAKKPIDNGNFYQVGDTSVEVLFSPQEDTMGRILAELDQADTSVHFQIFAFTKDQVGSRFVSLHKRFLEESKENGDIDLPVNERRKKVVGILDKSQLHGNYQYHEAYRMLAQGLPMRIDANANSYTPGDYQAGGGRLHTKTMILDYGTPNARVVTGSFNWSSAATISNDEVLMVLRGERVVEEYMSVWRNLWTEAVGLPQGICSAVYTGNDAQLDPDATYTCGGDAKRGDVIISEVHWDGWNGEADPGDRTGRTADDRKPVTNDEFIELYNTTDRDIDLSLWTIYNGEDAQMGFTPGTVIRAKSHFLLVDHNEVPYADVEPQRGTTAFQNADYVLNVANDPRFPRLNIRNSGLRIELRAPRDTTMGNPPEPESAIIDAVGDYGPPFAGGRVGNSTFSMERIDYSASGTDASNWRSCELPEGGANVVPGFRSRVVASPGERNSVATFVP